MDKYANFSPRARQILQDQEQATAAIYRYHIFKLLKGVIFLVIAYLLIYSNYASYFQESAFKTDIANYLLSLNDLQTFIFLIISFYVFLSWLLFGFSVWAAIWAAVITVIAGCYYGWHINPEIAMALAGMAYGLTGLLGVYSFFKGIFTLLTWKIRVENYRSGPILMQLIEVITNYGDEPESVKEYPYSNLTRLLRYIDAKVGARDNQAGLDLLTGKKKE